MSDKEEPATGKEPKVPQKTSAVKIAVDAEVKKLLGQITHHKNIINSVQNYINGREWANADEADITTRMVVLEDSYTKFCSLEEDVNQYRDYEKEGSGIRETYCVVKSGLVRKLTNLQSKKDVLSTRNKNTFFPKAKLPNIPLIEFDGQLDKWSGFRDSFKALVLSRDDLPDISKLSYLLSSLKGEAHKLAQTYSFEENSLAPLWEKLTQRYEKVSLLVLQLLNKLFTTQKSETDVISTLKSLLDLIERVVKNLHSLKISTTSWDPIFFYIIHKVFDPKSREAFYSAFSESVIPTYDEMITFLQKRVSTLESVRVINNKPSNINLDTKTKRLAGVANVAYQKDNRQPYCHKCQSQHYINKCPDFLKLKIDDRLLFVKSKNLCQKCLRLHKSSCFYKYDCYHCNSDKHNSVLCQKTTRSTDVKPEAQNGANEVVCAAYNNSFPQNMTLLYTFICDIRARDGTLVPCRVLWDTGSTSNIITRRMVNKLGMKPSPTNTVITGIGEKVNETGGKVQVTLLSRYNSFRLNINAIILHKINENIPYTTFSYDKRNVKVKKVFLADPNFNKPAPIDIILSAEYFFDLLMDRVILCKEIRFKETQFGYIAIGKVVVDHQEEEVCNVATATSKSQLDEQVARLWELQNIDQTPLTQYSKDEQYAVELFNKTTVQLETGHYQVRLPFKQTPVILHNTYEQAVTQLKLLERPINREKHSQTVQFLQNYLQQGHMVQVEPNFENQIFITYFPVVRKSSTNKVRVVFNFSKEDKNGVSFNDFIYSGPKMHNDILDILMMFRWEEIAMVCDVKDFFLSVKMHPDDQLAHIVFREDPDKPIKVYKLTSVAFGNTASPFLTNMVIKLVVSKIKEKVAASKAAQNMTDVVPILSQKIFVDDILATAQTVPQMIEIKNNLINCLSEAKMTLTKFASNKKELMEEHKTEHKVLGLLWDLENDILKYRQESVDNTPRTKRELVSDLCRISYDPLGFKLPLLVGCKILVQQLWLLQVQWDENCPENIIENYVNIRKNVNKFCEDGLPRYIINNPGNAKIVAFADASQSAYGTVIYIVNNYNDHITSNFLIAKNRVSPLAKISIPRLEIMAVVLMVKLVKRVQSILNINNVICYTDSTVVLCWLQKYPHTLKEFVAHRVQFIQENLAPSNFRYVPTAQNPADLLTKSVNNINHAQKRLWCEGPLWLTEKNFPIFTYNVNTESIKAEIKNVKSNKVVHTTANLVTQSENDKYEILERYSSYNKLINVTCYMYRYYKSTHLKQNNMTREYLTSEEKQNALYTLIKMSQEKYFSEEIKSLKNNKVTSIKSCLHKLTPFLDKKGLLRVGSRLQNAYLSESEIYPIILSNKCKLTQLLVRYLHAQHMHASFQLLSSILRTKYWIIKGRSLIKNTIYTCNICLRFRQRKQRQLMATLPERRVRLTPPFYNICLDYCGPFWLKEHKKMGKKLYKVWICLFVCMCTRAVHLELVTDLSSESFVSAFKRFISRRGLPKYIYSDNGTMFRKTQKDLNEFYTLIKNNNTDEYFQNFMSEHGVEWKFIPALSPHFNALAEANIGSLKSILKKMLKEPLTYEEYYTLVVNIEALLNSRPLAAVTDDVNDFNYLTPGHFLVQRQLLSYPEEITEESSVTLKSRWKYVNLLHANFSKQWKKEYLQKMMLRSKWHTPRPSPKLGQMVILKDKSLSPLQWKIGRIVEVFGSKDGHSRVFKIRSKLTHYIRGEDQFVLLDCE